MPYVDLEARSHLANRGAPRTAGELNYAISRLVDVYLQRSGALHYASINEVIGVLECAKLEIYRRLASGYEDRKRAENGDVFDVLFNG